MNERRAELIYGQVLQRMDMTRETGDEELQELIRMTLEEASEKESRYARCQRRQC